MKKRTRITNQRRRRAARKAAGRISIIPLYLITTLACFCVFTAVCMNINAGDGGFKAPSSSRAADKVVTEESTSTRPSASSQELDSVDSISDPDLIEALMRKKARLIQSRRKKGVEIAMVDPINLDD